MRILLALIIAVSVATFFKTAPAGAQGANQPPVITFISPQANQNFLPGSTITFTVTVVDPENGPLGGSQVFWSLAPQGGFESGLSFTRNNLPVGAYIATVRATDFGGLQSTALRSFTIGVPTPTPTNTHTPTPTPTNTNTPVPPTATHTYTPVPPTATHTHTPLPTATPVPPTTTHTHTATPTRTTAPVATATKAKPTKTATPTPKKATPTPTNPPREGRVHRCADLNGDGRVTGNDIGMLARAIARGSQDARYDINQNGRVGWGDLSAALRQLGRRCGAATPEPTTEPD